MSRNSYRLYIGVGVGSRNRRGSPLERSRGRLARKRSRVNRHALGGVIKEVGYLLDCRCKILPPSECAFKHSGSYASRQQRSLARGVFISSFVWCRSLACRYVRRRGHHPSRRWGRGGPSHDWQVGLYRIAAIGCVQRQLQNEDGERRYDHAPQHVASGGRSHHPASQRNRSHWREFCSKTNGGHGGLLAAAFSGQPQNQ
jgi:hypothetical protein